MPKSAPTFNSNRAFLERFGATIVQGGVTAIPSALYLYQGQLGLSPQHLWFISAILARKWNANLPYPSLKKMAERSGVSEQQLHNYKNQLVKCGWLKIIARRNAQGGQDTNYYDFSVLFERLETLLCQEREEDGGEADESLVGGLNPSLVGGLNPGLDKEETAQEEQSSNIRKDEAACLEEMYAENTLVLDEGATAQCKAVASGTSNPSIVEQTGSPPGRKQLPTLAQSGGVGSKERDAILPRIEQFAKEFGDKASLKSSTTRAYNLLMRSCLGVEEFVHCMWEARSLTKVRLTNHAGGSVPVQSKMGYFFSVLEERLGLGTMKTSGAD